MTRRFLRVLTLPVVHALPGNVHVCFAVFERRAVLAWPAYDSFDITDAARVPQSCMCSVTCSFALWFGVLSRCVQILLIWFECSHPTFFPMCSSLFQLAGNIHSR